MGNPFHYACCEKEMLGWIHEKMAIQELALRGGRFSTSDSTVVGNDTSACNDPHTPGKNYSTAVGKQLFSLQRLVCSRR
jgi:hypothetical protein